MRTATATVAWALAALAATAPAAPAAWSPARAISPGLPEVPAVGVGARGVAVMAGTSRAGVWIARLTGAGTSGHRQFVPGSRGDATAPAVVVSDAGQVTVAWVAGQPSTMTLIVASWRLGEPPARGVAVSRTGWLAGPLAMSAAPGGNAVIAWLEFQPGAPGSQRAAVAAAVVAPGAEPHAELLAQSSGQVLDDVAVGADRVGRPTVTWISRGPLGLAPATLMSAQPAPGAEPLASPLDGSALDQLHVLTGPEGGQLALWRELDTSGSARIMAAERAPGAVAFGPAQALASGRRLGELVAAGGRRGDVALAWVGILGRLNPVFALTRTPGGRWGPVQVVTARGRSGEQVAVGVDDRGHALVGWGSLHGTLVARAERGRLFGHRQRISVSRSQICWAPHLVVGGTGHAVATFVCNPPRPTRPSSKPALPEHELARYTPAR